MNSLTRSKTLLLLSLFTVLAYGNTTQNAFVWDDTALVIENNHIRNNLYLDLSFRSDLFHRDTAPPTSYYRPLQTISYMADYALWGLNPSGYHLTNLLLHLLCVILLALLLEKITSNRLLAFFVAALFAVHPVLTNAVAYIAGRADSLAYAGMLAAWLLWLPRRPLPFTAAILCYLAALCSRESAFLFPALIFLHSLLLNRTRPSRALLDALPFIIVALAFALWRHNVLSQCGAMPPKTWTLPFTTRLQIPFRALATYLGLLVWPARLQMERQVVLGGAFLYFLTAAGIAAVGGLIALACWCRHHCRIALFGLGWFAVTLLPVSGIFSLNATVAEHWLYVPCAGLFLAVMALVLQKPPTRPIIVAGFLILAGLTTRTIIRNRDWATPVTLFTQTRNAAPHSAAVHINLSREFMATGETNRAMAAIAAAGRLSPDDVHIRNNLAALYLNQNNLAAAQTMADESLRLEPDNPIALRQLAHIAEQRGDLATANQYFLRLIGRSRGVTFRVDYGNFLFRYKRYRQALAIAREAHGMEPGNSEAANLIGVILAETGNTELARNFFELARKLDRHSPSPCLNLARLHALRGDRKTAAEYYRQAVN